MKAATRQKIRFGRLVPVVVLDDATVAVDLADVLLAAGLEVMEITFRTPAAAAAIAQIATHRPALFVGAGTLLTPDQVRQASAAGAKFGVAPGLNPRTVEAAAEAGLDFIPGVAMPSEVERALACGLTLLKFFPAEALGGVNLLKALAGPYGHTGVEFIPTGGIHAGNLQDYLALNAVAAVGGSWFVDPKLICARDWDGIHRLTRDALTLAGSRGAAVEK